MAKQTMARNLITAQFPISKMKFSPQVAKAAMGLRFVSHAIGSVR